MADEPVAFDRVVGRPVTLNQRDLERSFLNGRYVLDDSSAGPISELGRLLVADFDGSWEVPGLAGALKGRISAHAAAGDRTATGVLEIQDRLRAQTRLFPVSVSPMLPRTERRLEMTDLERHMSEVAPSLRRITDTPYRRLRTETEVVRIGQLKRVARRAPLHLAGHSEDWGKRTAVGVAPLRILAERNEDDLAIYENLMVALTIRRAAQHLDVRLKDLRLVQLAGDEAARAAARLQRRSWRVTKRIAELLGEAFTETDRLTVLETQDDLAALRRQVGGLQDSDLFRMLDPIADRASGGHVTNLLRDDPRYRDARALWEELNRARPSVSREERIAEAQATAKAFTWYCLVVLLRALEQLELSSDDVPLTGPGGEISLVGARVPVTLRWDPADRFVMVIDDRPGLELLPLYHALGRSASEAVSKGELDELDRGISPLHPDTAVIVLYPSEPSVLGQVSDERLGCIPSDRGGFKPGFIGIGPLEPDGVERLARALRVAIGTHCLRTYPLVLRTPSRARDALLAATRGSVVPGDHPAELKILSGLDHKAVAAAKTALIALDAAQRRADETTELLLEQLRDASTQLVPAMTCPLCGVLCDVEHHFEPRSGDAFWCRCGSNAGCGSEWGLRVCTECGERVPVLIPSGVPALGERRESGWVVQVLGSETLASPCWAEDELAHFICTSCGFCPLAAERGRGCARCDKTPEHFGIAPTS